MRFLIFVICLLIQTSLFGQSILPRIEGWRVHAAFATNNCLLELGDYIWVGNASAIFTLHKPDNETEILSRVNGLSDVNVKVLSFDEQTKTTVIVYDNLNVDLIQEGRIYNIPDILNKLIIGEKTANSVSFNNGFAYVSCSFGIVVIDLAKRRLSDSYINLGANGSTLEILDVDFFQGAIYAATSDGIYRASLSSLNLSDYNFWTKIRSSTYSNKIRQYNGKIYAVIDSLIENYDGNSWSTQHFAGSGPVSDIKICNGKLVITYRNEIRTIDPSGKVQSINQRFATQAILSKEGELFCIVPDNYLVRSDLTTGALDYLSPSGPYATTSTRMVYANGAIWAAGGSVDGFGIVKGWGPSYNNNKFYKFDGNLWKSFKFNPHPRIQNARDFIDVAVHPITGNVFIASFGFGIIELKNDEVVNAYDTAGTSLQAPPSGMKVINISGIAFDENANLWIANADVPNPVSVFTKEGRWQSFSLPNVGFDGRTGFITLDDAGNKWIFSTRSNGIYVYNSGKNILDDADDQVKRLTKQAEQGLLPSEAVICVTKDQKGEMWVGTDQGFCIFRNPENIFRQGSSYDADQIVIKAGSGFANLLGGIPVYCIKVDPANRKWLGTANGAWLLSADGSTVVRSFNISNSPLLSNVVTEIGINEQTGEVFFVTEKGIISYIGTATSGNETHGDVLVYPNPVKPDYDGLIAIRGLVNNAFVKITDIKGQLVYETRANGGTATWDGRNFEGKRAATGVYLVYSSNQDGTETNVTKIVFIN